jgi:hypothetical protein
MPPPDPALFHEATAFAPLPGTPVVDALRQFYVSQTTLRSPFASLIFTQAFLERVVHDVQLGLDRATQFRNANTDPDLPFPWRHLLLILLHISSLDPQDRQNPMHDPEDVRKRVLLLCHEHLFSARRLLTRRLKTKPLLQRDRYMVQFAPTADEDAEPGVSADGRLLRFDSEYINNRDLGEVDVYELSRGQGALMRAKLDAVQYRHPLIARPGFGTGTVHKLEPSVRH